MSKSIFKKTAAIICGAATLVTIGMTAMMANAQEQAVDPTAREGLSTSVTNVIADQIYAEPGEEVLYPILIVGNKGYSGSGVALEYDKRLTPKVKDGTEDTPVVKRGPASKVQDENLSSKTTFNLDLGIWAFSTMGSEDLCTDDGMYVAAYFTVPSDAKPGDTFPMTLTVNKWQDTKNVQLDRNVIGDGWIKIKAGDTTTTTTLTTTSTTLTTTSTTETTTTTTESTSTTTQTTLSNGDTTSTTTLTTSGDGTTDTSSTTLDNGTTAPNNNTGTAAPPIKTGDAGVGAAVAGLMLAAAAAVAVATKKKED